jgi:hypothetical protein
MNAVSAHHDEFGLWFVRECFLEDLREAGLSLGDPAGVVLPDRVLVITKEFCHVRDGHAALEEDAGERVTEAVGCGGGGFALALRAAFLRLVHESGVIKGGAIIDHVPPRERRLAAVEK